MSLDAAINIDDLKRLARRRLPRIVFDYLESGAEDELAVVRNSAALAGVGLLPRYLVDVSRPDQSTELFGRRWASPFGIAPMGMMGLFRPDGDRLLAAAATAAGIPFVLSGASSGSIEATAAAAPGHFWAQLYAATDRRINEDLVRRARDAGAGVLVVAADAPTAAKRERNLRNGFSYDFRLRPGLVLDALRHPAWTAAFLRHGRLVAGSWARYAPAGAGAQQVMDLFLRQIPATNQLWSDLATWRRIFGGPVVVKGILHPADARLALESGADGIIVSNHGGRQLDRAPAPMAALPAIRDAVGGRLAVMLDGGIRRGLDIAAALALGARFVFVGRSAVYGLAAGGREGVARALAILREELAIAQGQMGCPTIADFTRDRLAAVG